MNESGIDGEDLVSLFEEMLSSLIAAIQANDWVEAGRLDSAFRGFADTLGNANLWQPVFPTNGMWSAPLLPAPSA